ncbi:MAG: threonylcarbamoyl-AMP synthase [Chloroflexi bacterium]|nr:threonylcarbamoyl-AMP synthase [Chloroflexota bacterium]
MVGRNRRSPLGTAMSIVSVSPEAIEQAAALLRRGGVVAFPTDTVYGLGAHSFLPEAVERVFRVKGRPAGEGLPVLLGEMADLERVAAEVPELALALARRFWPGPLTLVLKRHLRVPAVVSGGRETVAVRLPDHPVPTALARMCGAPITGTSANRSGGSNPLTAQDVAAQLGTNVDLVLDGGPSPSQVPSTIVDVTVEPPRVVRQGTLPVEELRRVAGVTLADRSALLR